MLYVTTRGTQDAYTAHRAIRQDRGPDGGFFVPMRMPELTSSEILSLSEKEFRQNVADVLNLLFGTKLTGWDVDVAIGRRVFATESIGHRTLAGQLWSEAHGSIGAVLRSLAERIVPELSKDDEIPNWLELGLRIGILFGVFGELLSDGQIPMGKEINVAVSTGSFAMPMALWYARCMGLPIRTIICGSNENGSLWDILHRGEVNTDSLAVKTTTPAADFALPPNLERLIHGALGQEQALQYCWCCAEGTSYSVSELDMKTLSEGMFAAVVSQERVASIIPSVYRTNRYILDPYTALAYGALADYRARIGSIGTTLVLCERSPYCSAAFVSKCLRVTPDGLRQMLSEK